MKGRDKEKQIIAALREASGGEKVPELSSEEVARGLSKEEYLHHLEDENRRLKLAVADLTLRNQALKLVVSTKW